MWLQNELLFSEIEFMQKRVIENYSNYKFIINLFLINIFDNFTFIYLHISNQELEIQNDNMFLKAKVQFNLINKVITINILTLITLINLLI